MHYIFIYRIGKVDTFLPLLVFVPVVVLLTMVPISLNGIGIREIAYATLFETIGVNPSVSIAMSLLFYSIIVVFSIPGALYSLRMLVNKEELKI